MAGMNKQSAHAVIMVRPAHFGSNSETLETNRFQGPPTADDRVPADARLQFDRLHAGLARRGIDVHVVPGRTDISLPDEIFPNNWLSLHEDGTAVLYPLLSPTRRLERRPELLDAILRSSGYRIDRVVDLTPLGREAKCLEGTGSLVLDRVTRTAYTCLSQRTHTEAVDEFARALGYVPFKFDGTDRDGFPIYHTNVMLSIGTGFAVVCAAAVADARVRSRLLTSLRDSGREIVEISFEQMAAFAGNLLELEGTNGRFLAMSSRALESLDEAQTGRLGAHGALVAEDIETIETHGGGSVRCMLAEVFLPHLE